MRTVGAPYLAQPRPDIQILVLTSRRLAAAEYASKLRTLRLRSYLDKYDTARPVFHTGVIMGVDQLSKYDWAPDCEKAQWDIVI
jgi:hypothetical protein